MNWSEKDNRTVYIYVILNKADKIAYVGQTMNPERRKAEHFENPFIKGMAEDIEWFGLDSFEFRVVDECAYRHRYVVEAYWIRRVGRKYALYNTLIGASHVESTKRRLSEVTAGINNPMYGKKDAKAVNGQHIQILNDNGELVKEFCSVKMAMKYFGLKGHTQIYDACKYGMKYKGYYWRKIGRRK